MTTNGNLATADKAATSIQGRAHEGQFVTGGIGVGPLSTLMLPMIAGLADTTPQWNYLFPHWRDQYLQHIARTEPMMGMALYSLKTRMVTAIRDYRVEGPDSVKTFVDQLLAVPGLSMGIYDTLPSLIAKVTEDLLSTDNGAFLERHGPGRPDQPLRPNLVTGFAHLDSTLCWRTFDPEYPVIYTNPQHNTYHRLHRSRVVMSADNPQALELARGIGFCAVSRALKLARIANAAWTYKHEKLAGRFTRGIGWFTGLTRRHIEEGLQATEEDAKGKGFIMYRGIPFFVAPGLEAGKDIGAGMLDLASIPDGYDWEKDTTQYAYLLSWAFGVDAREFWPATTSGATKGDAETQNAKSQRRGIGNLVEIIVGMLRACLPETAEFSVDVTDDEQDRIQNEIHKARSETLALLVDKKVITPEQMYKQAVADGVIDEKIVGPYEEPEPEPVITNPLMPTNGVMPPDNDTPTNEQEGQRSTYRLPGNALYEQHTNDVQRQLQLAVEDFIERLPDEPTADDTDRLTDTLIATLWALLSVGMTGAYAQGLGGAQPTPTWINRFQQYVGEQRYYLDNSFAPYLQAEISAGLASEETGETLRERMRKAVPRIALYAGAVWLAIWLGVGDNVSKPDSMGKVRRVRRVLDDRALHCTTCPPKAGDYASFEQMMLAVGLPADGSDQCKANCRCFIEVETTPGSGVFTRLNGTPTRFTLPLL